MPFDYAKEARAADAAVRGVRSAVVLQSCDRRSSLNRSTPKANLVSMVLFTLLFGVSLRYFLDMRASEVVAATATYASIHVLPIQIER
jgi:hypothetical protein